jgi:hypothetical protein
MEKEFIPYKQALSLKELGFDKKCFAHYSSFGYYNSESQLKWKRPIISLINGVPLCNKDLTWQEDESIILKQAVAPTFSQVFRWFREKYGLYSHIGRCMGIVKESYFVEIYTLQENLGIYDKDEEQIIYNSYEEAEIECLKKLIEKQIKYGSSI